MRLSKRKKKRGGGILFFGVTDLRDRSHCETIGFVANSTDAAECSF